MFTPISRRSGHCLEMLNKSGFSRDLSSIDLMAAARLLNSDYTDVWPHTASFAAVP